MNCFHLAKIVSQINNGIATGSKKIILTGPEVNSKFCKKILDILEKEGFIKYYKYTKKKQGIVLQIFLKYMANNRNVINHINLVSKPSRRAYISIQSLWGVKKGFGLYILSTSKGILTDTDARLLHQGGELLLSIT